jgi:hypothetical protein
LHRVSAGSCAITIGADGLAWADARAEGDWTFKPQTGFNILELQIDAARLWGGDPITVLLEDATAGSQMYYYSGVGAACGWEGTFTESFSVNSAHQYHMHAYIESTANDDGSWSGSIQATVTPEPATLLLLGLGAVLLRKRRS